MARSSQVQRVHRINAAHRLIEDEMTIAEAAGALAERFAVGKRQAYRYLREACRDSSPLPLPEPKGVFTVKLPVGLIHELRSHPRQPGQSLSDFVCQALRCALEPKRRRGGHSQS
jgi:predicted DNA-binding transcriptional regulator YafY